MDERLTLLDPAAAATAGEGRIGGKTQGLLRLRGAGSQVPPWCVVTTEAFADHLERAGLVEEAAALAADAAAEGAGAGGGLAEMERRAAALRARIAEVPLAADLAARLIAALPALGPGPFAVRSSLVGEDSDSHSFAGQLDTLLFQGPAEVPGAVARCWASAFTARAAVYRARAGAEPGLPRMGVVIQRMIDGQVSGVMFTSDPVTGRADQVRISACWGLGEGVVSGRCNSDEFVCDPTGHEQSATIADKDTRIVHAGPGAPGTREAPVPQDLRQRRCLTPAQLRQIVVEGVRLAEALGAPLDIEWTLAEGALHLLQARPITARAPASLPEPALAPGETDGPLVVWDNSNIQESYCGVTTPLTFSYARIGYASAYEQLMRIGRVPAATLAAQRPMLWNLLGLIHGRVYYNINNWYRMLSHLPSFRRNKQDMERMMGLDQPVDFVKGEAPSLARALRRLPWLISTFARLWRRFAQMDREVATFTARFDVEYRRFDRSAFATASFSQLLALVAQVRDDLSAGWHTPLINDLYVMMSSGRLRRLVERAVGPARAPALLANLMGGEEGIESTEPTRRVLLLSAEARRDPALRAALLDEATTLPDLRRLHPHFAAGIDRYIERYGDRCMGELKLETVSLREDPSFLLRLLRGYLDRDDLDAAAIATRERRLRGEAEAELLRAVGTLRARGAMRALRAARAAVKHRENLRLLRTLVFGLVRDLYRAIGDRLHAAGRLDHPRDVFYLTVEEIDGYHGGTAVSADTAALARARKAEYATYAALDPPHRMETRGPVHHGNALTRPAAPAAPAGGQLRGLGCYPGVVEAPARVIMNPSDDLTLKGHILVTLRTDPGWAPLFPLARGILVERGSTLSHSAILARELGIPAIVGVPGLLRAVRDGDRLRLDGAQGTIDKLEEP